jgi:hypothetical protein
MLLEFGTQSLGMTSEIDKAMNSWIPYRGLMNQKRIFNPLSFLEVRKRIVESPCCVYIQLSTCKEFGQFSQNLVWTSCIHTSSTYEHLMVETYRGSVNDFTHMDMSDGLFT